MNPELQSLLENRKSGEAQVAARKAHLATLKGEEAENHKLALAREEANLASILPRIAELEQSQSKPEKKP